MSAIASSSSKKLPQQPTTPSLTEVDRFIAQNGYNYQFEPNANLICPICRNAFVDPLTVSPCDHNFCRPCLTLAFHASGTEICPVDRQVVHRIRPPPRAVLNMVNELVVVCPFQPSGCPFLGQRQLLRQHLLDECLWSTSGIADADGGSGGPGGCCSRECGVNGLGTGRKGVRELGKHREKCPHRLVECEKCRELVKYMDMEGHATSCPASPAQCIHCPHLTLTRSSLPAHLLSCPHQSITCPHRFFGCDWRGPRRLLSDEHLIVCPYEAIKGFLAIFEGRFTELSEENRILRERVDEVDRRDRELRDLRRDVEACKASLGGFYQPPAPVAGSNSGAGQGARARTTTSGTVVGDETTRPNIAARGSGLQRVNGDGAIELIVDGDTSRASELPIPRQVPQIPQRSASVPLVINVRSASQNSPSPNGERPTGSDEPERERVETLDLADQQPQQQGPTLPDLNFPSPLSTPTLPSFPHLPMGSELAGPLIESSSQLLHPPPYQQQMPSASPLPVNADDQVHSQLQLRLNASSPSGFQPSHPHSLTSSMAQLDTTISSLTKELHESVDRQFLTAMNESLRIQEEVQSIRQALHGIRLQMHYILNRREMWNSGSLGTGGSAGAGGAGGTGNGSQGGGQGGGSVGVGGGGVEERPRFGAGVGGYLPYNSMGLMGGGGFGPPPFGPFGPPNGMNPGSLPPPPIIPRRLTTQDARL